MMVRALDQQFADFTSGKYTGSPGLLWKQLERSWFGLPDGQLDVLNAEYAPAERVSRGGQGWTVIFSMTQDLIAIFHDRDWRAMLVLADRAEEAGIDPELCDLTRRSLRVQYPS